MLSFFRRGGGLAQVIIGTIVILIVVVFVVEFRQGGRAQGKVSLECAVKVFDYCADAKEYDATRALIEPPGADPKWVRQQRLDRYALEGLAERELLVREAKRLGVHVGESALDEELGKGRARASLPVANARELSGRLGLCRVTDGRSGQCLPGADLGIRLLRVKNSKTDQFDYKVYERTIRVTTNRGAREFREMQQRELIAERLRQLVREPVRISEDLAYRLYQREHNRAVARVVSSKRDWFARYAVRLSDKQVADWAAGNESQVKDVWEQQKERFVAGCPLVSEIFVAIQSDATEPEQEASKKKLSAAVNRLAAGADFEEIARDISELDSAATGGLVGCFDAKRHNEEDAKKLLAALEGLKPGTATPAIETPRGYYILKLHGQLPEAQREEAGHMQIARELAVRFQADGLARQFADELLGKLKLGADPEVATKELVAAYLAKRPAAPGAKPVKVEPDSPLGAEAAPSCPRVEDTAPFTIVSNPVPNAQPSAAVASKLFELEKPSSVLPSPVETLDGFAVVVLKEKTLAKRADFDRDKAELISRLRDAKADDALAAYVARLRAQASDRIKISQALLAENEKKNAPSDSEE
jgi:parvulin-like peptidyl-prolyl isomerase